MKLSISALEYINAVKNSDFTVEEFASETLSRIKNVEEKVHAYLSVNENLINEAKAIDRKIKSGEKIGSCYGMPISVKDNMCIKNSKTTCASKVLQDFVAPYDATVISKSKS